MKKTTLILAALLAALAVAACGGSVTWEDEVTAGRFALLDNDCYDLSSDSACLGSPPPADGGGLPAGMPPNPPAGTEPKAPNTGELLPPEQGGCWFTGGGTFGKGLTRDSYGGNAMTMKDKAIRGEWEHVDHTNLLASTVNGQNLFHGKVHYIVCKKFPLSGPEVPKAVPNYINFGGTGVFNHMDGYFFDVKAFDHAEGGIHFDRYVIDIYDSNMKLVLHGDGQVTEQVDGPDTCKDDIKVTPDLAWVEQMGCVNGGNLQIHPPCGGHPY
jgi:hypothetical protein